MGMQLSPIPRRDIRPIEEHSRDLVLQPTNPTQGPTLAARDADMGVPKLVASASGTVIEIGPGSGNQVGRYDPNKITKIYGIEPNRGLHDKLRESIKNAGLSDVYTIVPCGVEDVEGLRKYGVDQEVFDTVLSIQVLCSVPNPKETAAALYRLLKPGGTMIVYEHVKSEDMISSKVQDMYNIVWPYLLANCNMNRDTAQILREAGDWAKVDLRLPNEEDAALAIPRIWGHLTKALKSNAQLDFSNPQAVPNRFNYILWLQDLLDTTSEDYRDGYDPEREVMGLDMCVPLFRSSQSYLFQPYTYRTSLWSGILISGCYRGTGSSCIYPLLGCAQRPKWKFIATDIDDKNISYARQNILRNDLRTGIRPLHTKPEDPLIPLDALGIESIDFTLTNPPFYPSPSSLLASAAAKSRPPHSACTGAPIEMVTPGGETTFVSRLIGESVILQERVQWYTTMLGKLSSVSVVVEELKAKGVTNWAVKEFVQGGKTRRWGVGWSWGGRRPREDVARGVGAGVARHLLPFPSGFVFEVEGMGVGDVAVRVDGHLKGLDLRWQYRPQMSAGVGFAKGNVWSRAARRQQRRGDVKGNAENEDSGDDEEEEWALGLKVQLLIGKDGKGTEVIVRWLLGRDSVLWESFCGMLKRQIVGG
ncbi:MAG: hypothetical protein Q9184_002343 [Pyrenodesmia sp. 2 TL-2023]